MCHRIKSLPPTFCNGWTCTTNLKIDRQYSAYTVRDRLSTLTVTNFNHRRRTQERRSYSFQISGWSWHGMQCACYIEHEGSFFIHGIMSAKRTCEVQPAVLIRENSAQPVMYLLDTCIGYSTYIPIFKSQKGSMEALVLNFLVIIS